MKDLAFLGVLVFGMILLYKYLLGQQSLQAQQLANAQAQQAAQNAYRNSPWITVPGAISAGAPGIASIVNSLNNLFSDDSY